MKTLNRIHKQAGLTLIEVLVAMTLGLIVIGAAIGMQITHQQGFKLTETKLGMQTNAKFAFEFVASALRELAATGCRSSTNYAGVSDPSSQIGNADEMPKYFIAFNNLDVPFANFQVGQELLGYENAEGSTTWVPAVSPDFGFTGDMLDGSDAITIRGAIGNIYPVDATVNAGTGLTSIQIKMDGIGSVALQPEQYGVLSQCDKAEVFNMTGTEGEFQTGLIKHASGTNGDENASGTFNISLDGRSVAELRRMAAVTFYIGNNEFGVPTLYRDVDGRSDPLVEGVERMQIEYGVITDDTNRNVPNEYHNADWVDAYGGVDNPTEGWRRVRSVRLSFIMRSKDRVYDKAVPHSYRLPGAAGAYSYDTDDRYSRLIYSATVNLRNRTTGPRINTPAAPPAI